MLSRFRHATRLVALLCAIAPSALAACTTAEEDLPPSAFDGDDNGDGVDQGAGGKGDRTSTYRDGCGDLIRHGVYALHGNVVMADHVVEGGYVVVENETIREVREAADGAPEDATTVVETEGYIYPGLLDGHSHVEYNHIPMADLGKRYQNRDQWPNASLYQTLVKDPKNAVTKAGLKCEALRHGEARALVGGTTGIQGTPDGSCVRPLVRNLEQFQFCRDKVRQNVMSVSGFDRGISGKPSFADSVHSDIQAGKLDAFVVHIAEGIDEHARSEWQWMKDLDLALPQAVMIHTAAFTAEDYQETAAAGAKIVWSPLSNMLLYGATADIPAALDAGVMVALGADWAPSGSANVLGELKVADRINKKLWNDRISDEELFQMVTINPAIEYGWDDVAGSIEAGKVADLLVIREIGASSAYRTLIEAQPQDVVLVTISGDALYGDSGFLEQLGKQGDFEMVDACGEQRGIDVTVDASDVPKAGESLAEIESKLVKVNPKLTPIVDCTDDEMTAALEGTAAE